VASLFALFTVGTTTQAGEEMPLVDQQHIEYVMEKRNTVPIVFENGLGGNFNRAWIKIMAELAPDNTIFAYNRPGNGESDAVTTPRDGEHVVAELRVLLHSEGLNPPYVLVGHSSGGLYMQYFARRYPDEVAALVLVDSTHPNQVQGDGAIKNWPAWDRLLLWLSPRVIKNELAGAEVTGEAISGLPPLTGKPVILLSALHPVDANEMRKDLLRLYPGAKQIWVDSGHNIQIEKPEAVVAAIREALSLLPRNDSTNLK
jgi:pimeloyl-ACP methyl ester carboxylesterase